MNTFFYILSIVALFAVLLWLIASTLYSIMIDVLYLTFCCYGSLDLYTAEVISRLDRCIVKEQCPVDSKFHLFLDFVEWRGILATKKNKYLIMIMDIFRDCVEIFCYPLVYSFTR